MERALRARGPVYQTRRKHTKRGPRRADAPVEVQADAVGGDARMLDDEGVGHGLGLRGRGAVGEGHARGEAEELRALRQRLLGLVLRRVAEEHAAVGEVGQARRLVHARPQDAEVVHQPRGQLLLRQLRHVARRRHRPQRRGVHIRRRLALQRQRRPERRRPATAAAALPAGRLLPVLALARRHRRPRLLLLEGLRQPQVQVHGRAQQ